ncbi:hypothetical protein CM1200mP19_1120 [bacterium]|nr:MAG: hypothetical protein CM1200mP19_1120 [bacterium]
MDRVGVFPDDAKPRLTFSGSSVASHTGRPWGGGNHLAGRIRGSGGEAWMGGSCRGGSSLRISLGVRSATMPCLAPNPFWPGAPKPQKQRFIPPLLRAHEAWCQLFSEPGAGLTRLDWLPGRFLRDSFVIDGQKVWSSCAQFCDWGSSWPYRPRRPQTPGHQLLPVDMSTPGVEVRPLVPANGSTTSTRFF